MCKFKFLLNRTELSGSKESKKKKKTELILEIIGEYQYLFNLGERTTTVFL